jgi:hypothetical protein
MTVRAAFIDGWRRVQRAPRLIVGLWVSTLLLTLPLAFVLRDNLAEHLDASLAANEAATGVNFDWWNEYLSQATGLGRTFVPAIIGFAAVVKNVSGIVDAVQVPRTLAMVIAVHLGVSLFLLGGVLDRLSRDRAVGVAGFFSACGGYLFRFLRLMALASAAYAMLFLSVHAWLFDVLYPAWTRELTVERTAFAYRLVLYVVFAAALAGVNLLFDYAKIRMVVEDRRSAIGALVAALRFVRRHPAAVITLYLLNTGTFLLVLGFYYLAAPGASGGRAATLAGLAIAQLYIVLRLTVRLGFAATQIALFQGRLAHAGYTARRPAQWPDSPAAEALARIE